MKEKILWIKYTVAVIILISDHGFFKNNPEIEKYTNKSKC